MRGAHVSPRLAAALCFVVAGCALGSRTPRLADPNQTLEVRGLTVRAPHGVGWYVVQHDPAVVHFSKETGAGGAHTVLAFAATADAPAPIEGRSGFRRMVAAALRQDLDDPRFAVHEVQVTDVDLGHVECERVDFSAEDHGVPYAPGQTFLLVGYDVVCPHPAAPRTLLVRIGTSQRFTEDRVALRLDDELAPFFASLEFTSP
jgi:hypothetical protein